MKKNNSKKRGLSPPVIRTSIVGFSFVALWGILVIYAGGGGAEVLGRLQFLDPIILPGIEVYSSCYGGDAAVSKSLLMIAWLIGLVLLFLTPLLLGDSVKWYLHHLREFRDAKVKSYSSSPRILFVPLYWLLLFLFFLILIYAVYFYIRFMGFWLADQLSCSDLRTSSRTGLPSLFIDGVMLIIISYMLCDFLVFLTGCIKFRHRDKRDRIKL